MILIFVACLMASGECRQEQARISEHELAPSACGAISQQYLASWFREHGEAHHIVGAKCVPAWRVEREA